MFTLGVSTYRSPYGASPSFDHASHPARLFQINKKIRNFSSREFQEIVHNIQKGVIQNILSLPNHRITNDQAIRIIKALAYNKSITFLILSENLITDDGVQEFAPLLKSNTVLQTLDLSFNKISARGAEKLLNELQENYTLISINLAQNQFDDLILEDFAYLTKRNIEIQQRRQAELPKKQELNADILEKQTLLFTFPPQSSASELHASADDLSERENLDHKPVKCFDCIIS